MSFTGITVGSIALAPPPFNQVQTGMATKPEADRLRAALVELLRLYDWRNELGRIERDFNHDKKQMKTWLNQYGREKKAAWDEARRVLGNTIDSGKQTP